MIEQFGELFFFLVAMLTLFDDNFCTRCLQLVCLALDVLTAFVFGQRTTRITVTVISMKSLTSNFIRVGSKKWPF